MIVKSEVKLIDGAFVFTLDISVNKFFDEPWNNLGKRVSFSIDSSEDMEMFEKQAKIWGWKLPAKMDTKKRQSGAKLGASTEKRKLNDVSPDNMSTISSMRKFYPKLTT